MSTKRHHSSKSSEIPKLLSNSDLHAVYRSPPLLSTSNSLTKSLLSRVIKPHSKLHASKISQKSLKPRPIQTTLGKSITLTKDSLFDFDTSKEISVLRPRDETTRTVKAAAAISHRREFCTERSLDKSTPKALLTHSNSELIHREQFESQVIFLELKLTEQLKMVNKTSSLPFAFDSHFPIYSAVFQEVIDRDKHFGSLLAKIKTFYETWLQSFSKRERDSRNEQLYDQCSEQLRAAKHKLKLQNEDKKLMLRRIGALSKETVELSQNIQELETENEELREKINKIRSVDLAKVPTDEKTWKCLVVENRSYQSEVHRLRKKAKHLSLQVDSLQCLILRMKDRGFPIEELEDFPPDDSRTDLEDLEPITSGPPRSMEKPINVPSLRLKGVSNEEEETENQQPEQLPRDVDVLASMDRGEIEDFHAFLVKEVSKEPSAPMLENRYDDYV